MKGQIGALLSGIIGSQTAFAADSDTLDFESIGTQDPEQLAVSAITGIIAMLLNRFLDNMREKRRIKKAQKEQAKNEDTQN